ncbi:MAG: formate C-acetyltransferase/glycerol dehydratase family glycyl radical enzyme, partial [Planctomycetes bacterium]|nr:formate C-acetyltransferase/glycerol dehydratase family glycyl radical enzyme [Planctomycetota bacterium]
MSTAEINVAEINDKTFVLTPMPAAAGAMSDRVRRLRERVMAAKLTVCLDRARIYTEVYRKNEEQPVLIRRALALRETFTKMRIWIDDDELLVGCHASRMRAAPIFPEYSISWILQELDEFEKRPGDAFFLSEDDKAVLREILPWWEGKTLCDRGVALMSDELREIFQAGIILPDNILNCGDAHIAIHHAKLLERGINGYLQEVESRMAALDPRFLDDLKKRTFYQSVKIALEGMSDYIERFEKLAAEKAGSARDPKQRENMTHIAEVCRHIKRYPARDFLEALQLTCFSQILLQIESNGHSLSLGRLDQYLFPYYRRDVAEGKISEERAVELLQCLWIKMESINKLRSWKHTRASAGSPLYQNVTIGGQTPDGRDAVNPLSYLILRSVGGTKLPQPNLSVRFHAGMSDDFMFECLKVIELGFGMPAFNNDEIVVPEFIRIGVEPNDARDYSAIGCIEVAVPGRWGYRAAGMSFINLMRVFMTAIYGGKDMVSGKTFLEGEGTLRDFASFDQVMRAWEKQAHFYARAMVAIDTAVDLANEENVPDILCSAFVDNCLERGKTIKEGGSKYDFVSG